MRHRDDQCVQCGGIRVAKSTLCSECLVTWKIVLEERIELNYKNEEVKRANAAVIISEKNAEIEELKYQLRLTRRILRHIFREYQILQKVKALDIIA